MPDPLPVPREAIDAFIREKGVTKVERGATGLLDENGKFKSGVWKWSAANKGQRPKPKPKRRPVQAGVTIKPMPTPRSDREKRYVELRLQGKSFGEIAAICGVSRGSVSSSFNYMRKREWADG